MGKASHRGLFKRDYLAAGVMLSILMIAAAPVRAQERLHMATTASVQDSGLMEDLLKPLLALPTVVVSQFVYTLVFSQGPLGEGRLLFTPAAIILGQAILVMPLVAALSCSATILVATHDLNVDSSRAHRCVRLNAGRTEEAATCPGMPGNRQGGADA